MSRNFVSVTFVVFAAAGFAVQSTRAADISPLGAGVQNYVSTTMEGAYAWYERGFDANAPTTGLPPAGVFQSQNNANWSFRMQAYNQNNVTLLSPGNTVATMTFSSPVTANAIAIASATAAGPDLFSPTIHFSDGTPDYIANLFTDPEWGDSSVPWIYASYGRIDIVADPPGAPLQDMPGEFNDVGYPVPLIHVHTVTLPGSLAVHPISSVTFNWTQTTFPTLYTSKTAIFGISTSTDSGTTFVPGNLTASSFNADVVVEASALPEPTGAAVLVAIAMFGLRRPRAR